MFIDQHGAMTTVFRRTSPEWPKAFAREQAEIAKFRGRKDTYLNILLDTVNFWASRVPRAQFLLRPEHAAGPVDWRSGGH
jgi:hypothetical protein